MNIPRMCLVLPAAAAFALAAPAAPVPERAPESQGPISDGLRVRGQLPATAPPVATKLAVRGDAIEVARMSVQYVAQTRTENVEVVEFVQRTVQKGGKQVVENVPVKRLV